MKKTTTENIYIRKKYREKGGSTNAVWEHGKKTKNEFEINA